MNKQIYYSVYNKRFPLSFYSGDLYPTLEEAKALLNWHKERNNIDNFELIKLTIENINEAKKIELEPKGEITEDESKKLGLSECENCGELAWDDYICHNCGVKLKIPD